MLTKDIVLFYGTLGSRFLLITNQHAKEAGYKSRSASLQMSGLRSGSKKKAKIQYRALMRKMDG
jgi:hypothetical protein